MNMMAFKNQNQDHVGESGGIKVNRSFAISNRAFGKDITQKVLNSSGAVGIPSHMKDDKENHRKSMVIKTGSRKPSPSMNSNY